MKLQRLQELAGIGGKQLNEQVGDISQYLTVFDLSQYGDPEEVIEFYSDMKQRHGDDGDEIWIEQLNALVVLNDYANDTETILNKIARTLQSEQG